MIRVRTERFCRRWLIVAEKEHVKKNVPTPSGPTPIMGVETMYWTGRHWVKSTGISQAEEFTDPKLAEELIEQGTIQEKLPRDWRQANVLAFGSGVSR
jgi:hypothetical protein